jgi:hypothetical protein
VNDFLEQCRREWKRLRVPDSLANDMAAELAADLKEAEAEGVSAEEVLGNAVADPRSFAAYWADERGVIPLSRSRLPTRSLVLGAIVALTVTTAIGAALVLFASPHAPAPGAAIGVLPIPRDTPILVTTPAPAPTSADAPATIRVGGDRDVTLAETSGSGVEIHTVGSILLIVGIAGLIASLLVLIWSFRTLPSMPSS